MRNAPPVEQIWPTYHDVAGAKVDADIDHEEDIDRELNHSHHWALHFTHARSVRNRHGSARDPTVGKGGASDEKSPEMKRQYMEVVLRTSSKSKETRTATASSLSDLFLEID